MVYFLLIYFSLIIKLNTPSNFALSKNPQNLCPSKITALQIYLQLCFIPGHDYVAYIKLVFQLLHITESCYEYTCIASDIPPVEITALLMDLRLTISVCISQHRSQTVS